MRFDEDSLIAVKRVSNCSRFALGSSKLELIENSNFLAFSKKNFLNESDHVNNINLIGQNKN